MGVGRVLKGDGRLADVIEVMEDSGAIGGALDREPVTSVRRSAPPRAVVVLALAAASLAMPSTAPARQPDGLSSLDTPVAMPIASGSTPSGGPPGSSGQQSEPRGAAPAGCQITLEAARTRLVAGESTTLGGSLSCPTPADAVEQPVLVYEHDAGTPGSVLLGTARTEADGAYRFAIDGSRSNSSFFVRRGRVRSAHVSVRVAPAVTISARPESAPSVAGGRRRAARRGSVTMTFTGAVSPAEAGARVVLQRERAASEDWFRIGMGEVGDDGTYSITHTFRPGTVNVRVAVRSRHLLGGVSESLSYQIARPQNPQLTIQGVPDVLAYGGSVTLRGTLATGAHEPVTLLARTRQSAFAPVASVATDGSGNYSFPAQSPLQNTWYEVTARKQSSIVLLERVKPLITAAVASAEVAAGEPLTFSGTIAPSHPGQPVYLERQNADGLGFHVVDIGAVAVGGTYSIDDAGSGAGTQAYRVKVPGDPEKQAVTSQPMEIQVTAQAVSRKAEGPVSPTASPEN